MQYGNFLQTIEDWDGAEEQYKKVLETEGHELHDRVIVDAINNYATMLHEQRQDFEGANALYEQAAAKKPDDVDLLFNWVRCAPLQLTTPDHTQHKSAFTFWPCSRRNGGTLRPAGGIS